MIPSTSGCWSQKISSAYIDFSVIPVVIRKLDDETVFVPNLAGAEMFANLPL